MCPSCTERPHARARVLLGAGAVPLPELVPVAWPQGWRRGPAASEPHQPNAWPGSLALPVWWPPWVSVSVAAVGAWEEGVSQGRCPGLRPRVSLLALAQRPVSCQGRLPEVRPRPRVSVSACLSRGVASWRRVPCGLVRTALRITSSLWIVPFGVEKRLCPVGPGSAVPDQDPGPCCSHQPGAPLSPRRSSPAGSPW